MKQDPLALLCAGHRHLSALFDAVEAARGHRLGALFGELITALNLHAELEEGCFYPLLEDSDETRYRVIQAYDDHDLVKALLAGLSKLPVGSAGWKTRLKAVRESVDDHVAEEEEELLPEARQILTREQVCQLWDDMVHVRSRYQPEEAHGLPG